MRITSIIGIGFSFALAASVGINVFQYQKTDTYSLLNDVNRDRSRINQDSLNEVLLGYMNDIRTNTLENARQSGKLEGILAVAFRANPAENEHSAIWHGGYERGLSQTDFVGEMQYEKGYQNGMIKGREEYLKSINNILDSKEDFKSALKDFINNKQNITAEPAKPDAKSEGK